MSACLVDAHGRWCPPESAASAASHPWRHEFRKNPGKDGVVRVIDAENFRLRASVVALRLGAGGAREVLMVGSTAKRKNGLLVLPGGGLDPDEEPSTSAAREAYEEAGIIVSPEDLRCVGVWIDEDKKTKGWFYACDGANVHEEASWPEELRGRQWTSASEMLETAWHPVIRNAISKGLAELGA